MKEGAVVDATSLDARQRRVAFATVLVAFTLEIVDSTIVNTALPSIRTSLGASDAAMQWIVAGYFLTLGSLLLLGGRLGDAFGYRRVFLGGVGAFVVASVLCGLAQTADQLIVARLLQGIAGAMMGPQVMAIIQILFTPLERVGKLAWFGVLGGVAAILGPVIGGALIELDLFGLGWRLIFLINLPAGAIALWAGRRTIPTIVRETKPRIDLVGAGVFAMGFGLVLLALIEGAESGWPLSAVAAALAGAVLVATGWRRAVLRRAAGRPAMIEPALFGLRTFRWGLVALLAFNAATAGFLLILAIALQQGLGLTALQAALVHVPFSVGVMAGISLIGRRYLPVLGRWLLVGGATLMAVGATIALTLIAGETTGAGLAAALVVAGMGMGMVSGPLPPVIVADVDRTHAGVASATLRTAQQLGGATGVAAIGAAYFSVGDGGAAAKLAGLAPGSVAVVAFVAVSILAAICLPPDIFGARRRVDATTSAI